MQETILYKTREREELFVELYQTTFPYVARYVHKMNGTLEEAKDIFHDALLIYYEKIHLGTSVAEENEKGYILGIAKHLWLKKFKEKNQCVSIDALKGDPSEADPVQWSSAKIVQFLKSAGEKCMELLEAFYFQKMEASQIAEKFGYSGVRSATVQKYKCLEKVRNTVKAKSIDHEDFTE